MASLRDNWQSLGQSGLLGVGLQSRFGGQGGGPAEIWRTAKRVGYSVFDLGISLSWVTHSTAARFLIGQYGSEEQKAAWIPRLVSGESMVATAFEERESTPEDWNFRTSAQRLMDNMIQLDGLKLAAINAPLADLVVAFAATPTAEDPYGISAFMVHRDTKGVSFEDALPREFCPSSPRANVVFSECHIPVASLLGKPGDGERMLALVKEQHDLLLLQVVSGHLAHLLDEVKPLVRRSDRDRLSLLALQGRLLSLQALNAHIADHWEQRQEKPIGFAAAQMASREVIQRTREDLVDLPEHPAVLAAQRDLDLISLGWSRTKRRLLDAVRLEEESDSSSSL